MPVSRVFYKINQVRFFNFISPGNFPGRYQAIGNEYQHLGLAKMCQCVRFIELLYHLSSILYVYYT